MFSAFFVLGKEILYMELKLLRADIDDAEELHIMQIKSFKELLDKYNDYDTNPANESIENVEIRLKQDFTYYYFICYGLQKTGAIRIVDKKETGKNKRISPLFILPEFQDRGFAQKAILLCEEIHGNKEWELATILQEQKNCYLYEKMGYIKTDKTIAINEKLTLVIYKK